MCSYQCYKVVCYTDHRPTYHLLAAKKQQLKTRDIPKVNEQQTRLQQLLKNPKKTHPVIPLVVSFPHKYTPQLPSLLGEAVFLTSIPINCPVSWERQFSLQVFPTMADSPGGCFVSFLRKPFL